MRAQGYLWYKESIKMSNELTNSVTEPTQTADDLVSKAELKRVLDDMHKFKARAKELESMLEDQKLNKLKENNQWKEIAESKEKEAETLQQQLDAIKNAMVKNTKFNVIKSEAIKRGIRNEALDDLELLNFDDYVTIETTSTGRINVLGADLAIEDLKRKKPHWFGKQSVSMNNASPEAISSKISYEQVQKELNEAKKTGDYSKAESLLNEYKKQRS